MFYRIMTPKNETGEVMRYIFEGRRLVMLGLLLAAVVGFMEAAVAAPAFDAGAMAQSKAQQVNVAPDYAALAALLEDPKSRAALIKELQRLAAESPTGGAATRYKKLTPHPRWPATWPWIP
jgi:hypothetical protein